MTYTLSQTLAIGVSLATFDLSEFNFSQPPSNIVPTVVRIGSGGTILIPSSRQWTSTSFTCDFSAPTIDSTSVCTIQIYP